MTKRKEPAILLSPPIQSGVRLSDREYVKLIARKMLARLEKTVEGEETPAECESEGQRHLHEQIFGPKTPLTHALVTLSDLLLRLADEREPTESATPLPLSPGDIALVEGFCARVREQRQQELGQQELGQEDRAQA